MVLSCCCVLVYVSLCRVVVYCVAVALYCFALVRCIVLLLRRVVSLLYGAGFKLCCVACIVL